MGRAEFGYFLLYPYKLPCQWRALDEIFSLIWLLEGLSSKITKLRSLPPLHVHA